MNNLCSFFQTKCVMILLLAILTSQYPATGKNSISQTKDFCPRKKEAIQFWEFRSEHSAEEYELPPQVTDSLTFDLSFCTSTKMAIIAELQNFTAKQTVTLEIVDGFLSVAVEEIENPKPRCVWSISDKPVNDKTLHTVKVKVSPQLLSIELYHMYKLIRAENSLMYSSCLGNKTLSKFHSLILGGLIIDWYADGKIQVLYSFDGCMRNIRIDGRNIENVAKQLTSADVTPGCPEFDESCTQVCPETAEYKDGFCVCPEGKEIDANGTCSPSCSCIICQNGGFCNSSSSSGHCKCPRGFSGALCEVILNPCDGILCNNGSCITDNDSTSYECKCNEGYEGKFCDKKDMCLPNPCHNGGTCKESPEDDIICVCPPGVSGKSCGQRLDITEDDRVLLFSVIGGISGGGGGVAILLLICFCIWKNRKRLPCFKTDVEQTNPAGTDNQKQRRTLVSRLIQNVISENSNNQNNQSFASSVENATAVTGRTEQPEHPEDPVGSDVQHSHTLVPTITYSRNENNCVVSLATFKSISNKATAVTKNIASCVIYSNIRNKNEGHKKLPSLKSDSDFVIEVKENSDKTEDEKSHCLKRNERNSDQTDNVKSHYLKCEEEHSDKKDVGDLKRDEEEFHREVDESNSMSISCDGDARELYNFNRHEENCDKKTGEFNGIKKNEGTSYKDVQKSHSLKVDGGHSEKVVRETHSIKGEENNSDEEENFEGNSTEITEVNKLKREEEETELQENSISQCQQDARSVASEQNEIFI